MGILNRFKRDDESIIKYTRRGGIYVKPSDIAQTEKGKRLIKSNSNSKLAASIQGKKED